MPCFPLWCRYIDADKSIRNELQLVRKQSAEKVEKLSMAVDEHIGLEILHLFVLDLLGRETPAARIFESKTDEEFEHARVVTKTSQSLAAVGLFGVVLFSIYYTLVTGLVKGVGWQRSFLAGCIVQGLVEVLIFETMVGIIDNVLLTYSPTNIHGLLCDVCFGRIADG